MKRKGRKMKRKDKKLKETNTNFRNPIDHRSMKNE